MEIDLKGSVPVVLKDGTTVLLRRFEARDFEALRHFLKSALSPHSQYLFFGREVSEQDIDAYVAMVQQEFSAGQIQIFLALSGIPPAIIAFATLQQRENECADVRFAVADQYQGLGIGTHLVEYLMEAAYAQGIRYLTARMIPENHQMIQVVRDMGIPLNLDIIDGQMLVTFPTQLSEEAKIRFEQREQIAAVNALKHFLAPKSIAVIGASRDRSTISGKVFYNLLSYGFEGPVYPVNPKAAVVQSVPAYPTVEDIPGEVELAFVVVPAKLVPAVARQCARKGVKAMVVISSGFAEIGPEGQKLQDELLRICRQAGIRLIGPNCMGIENTDPAVRLHGTFVPFPPPEGRLGFLSQSGALGVAVMEYAHRLGMGLSTFVSVGNKADISGNDLLQYWESDPRTDVILLYLESFGNPRKFSRIARRIGKKKPIVVVKSGRSRAGTRATASHTGALLEASDATVDALFHQAGVIRTDTMEQMFDVAALLLHQPLPNGENVAIITNGGGPAILCADACEAEGLKVVELSPETQKKLREFLPTEASVVNPVDMIASATAEDYARSIEVVASDPGVDAIIVIFIPPLLVKPEEAATAILQSVRKIRNAGNLKPVLSVFMLSRGAPQELRAPDLQIPAFSFPEDAAIALSRVVRYALWRQRPEDQPYDPQDVSVERVHMIVARALGENREWLTPEECREILESYHIPLLPQRIVRYDGYEELLEAAHRLGYPVVVKAIAPGLIHKSDIGAVVLDITTDEQLVAAAKKIEEAVEKRGFQIEAFLVQPMVKDGVEFLVGVTHDLRFGPVLAVAAGGVLVELLKDVSIRLTPIGKQDAREMLQQLKTYPLLTGYRGKPPCNVEALEQIILGISALVEDVPYIRELDCNPVIVTPETARVVDVRIRVFDPKQEKRKIRL